MSDVKVSLAPRSLLFFLLTVLSFLFLRIPITSPVSLLNSSTTSSIMPTTPLDHSLPLSRNPLSLSNVVKSFAQLPFPPTNPSKTSVRPHKPTRMSHITSLICGSALNSAAYQVGMRKKPEILGTLRMLRLHDSSNKCRVYECSTSVDRLALR